MLIRNYIFSLLAISTLSVSAQEASEIGVKNTIETFFEGFHAQDSVQIKQVVADGILLQTIAKNEDKSDYVKKENFSLFLKSIVGIPANVKFQEKLTSFTIKIDGPMANAWVEYEFWLNDSFSHCGVNSFQLFKEGTKWKIIYLIDTRRKHDCN